MAEAARVLLGHEQRHAEDRRTLDQKPARDDDAIPAVERASVALLDVDEDEDGSIAVEERRMPHTASLAKLRNGGNAIYTHRRDR